MKNNQTTTEATREALENMKVKDSHCGLPFSLSSIQVDEIMQLIAKEKKALLQKISDDLSQIFADHRDFETKESIRKDVAEYFINSLAHSQEDREGKE